VVTTNEITSNTYTLDCKGTGSTGTEPGKTDKPKPFFIVVPAGTYGFNVSVKDASGTQLYTVSTLSNKTFAANEIHSMKPLGYPGTDAQPVSITTGDPATTTVWAPVNCGYVATDYPYGKLYQWGRAMGCGYNDGSEYTETLIQEFMEGQTDDPEDLKFYKGLDYGDWYSGSPKLSLWPMMSTDSGYSEGKIDNPCPEGWRVPTMSELDKLAGGDGTGSAALEASGWDSENIGYWFNGTNSPESGKGLFLPAAGFRSYSDGSALARGLSGYYWSSSVKNNSARVLDFGEFVASMLSDGRANGYSVRCVQE